MLLLTVTNPLAPLALGARVFLSSPGATPAPNSASASAKRRPKMAETYSALGGADFRPPSASAKKTARTPGASLALIFQGSAEKTALAPKQRPP